MTLSEFLLARIAEDETRARRYLKGLPHEHDRVLADCAAKRGIVSDWDVFSLGADQPIPEGGDSRERLTLMSVAGGLRRAIWRLATVYSAHPDYDEAWRP